MIRVLILYNNIGIRFQPLNYNFSTAQTSAIGGARATLRIRWAKNQLCVSGVVGEYFSFYLAEVESAVGLGEVDERVHLLVDKGRVIAHDGTADDRQLLAVLGLHLGDGEIEPALQPPDKTLDDTAFLLQGLDPLQMNMHF